MNEILFKQNLNFFQSRVSPELYKKLSAGIKNDHTLTGTLEDGTINLLKQNIPLYPKDAVSLAVAQVKEYSLKPERFFSENPTKAPRHLKMHHDNIIIGINEHLSETDIAETPGPDAGFLVTFGLGLGISTFLLSEKYPCRNLVIVEPEIDFIILSMHTLQWGGLFTRYERNGGRVYFICEEETINGANEAFNVFRSADYSLVDGSYLYQHYESPYFAKLIPNYAELLITAHATMGFFEDECVMMRHACENLKTHDFSHLTGKPAAPISSMPAFIVGSGPSIDKSIKDIAKNKDKAVIFSGGTGISVLHKNGLVPDFHCEIENDTMLYSPLKNISDGKGFKDTILIAPTTVDPRLPTLFKSTIFFHRDSVSPTRIFCDQADIITHAGPTVTNLASRAAIALGFPELILFGVDLGSINPDKHHSSSSVYETHKEENMPIGTRHEIVVEGNKRKTVFTNYNFLNARMFFEKLFSLCVGVQIYNCSDGIRLAGSKPADSKKINIQNTFVTKEKQMMRLMARLAPCAAGSQLKESNLKIYLENIVIWHRDAKSALNIGRKQGFKDLYNAMSPLLLKGEADIENSTVAAVKSAYSGSVMEMLKAAYYYYRRLDAKSQQPFLIHFCDIVENELDIMHAKATEVASSYLSQ